MRGYFIKPIGQNRGKPRIWLENLQVSAAGLGPGDRYDVEVKGGTVTLRANPDGSRVVSAKENKRTNQSNPIIDINSAELLALFDGMDGIRVVQREGEIHLLPLASEIKKKERLSRLKTKLQNNVPLEVSSLSHGGGLLDHAVHAGLDKAGISANKQFANEIRPELLDHASGNPHWGKDTIPLGAPMQELAFDERAMQHLPRSEIMVAGLPCSGASVAGRAKRGTAHPEAHPEVGHLVVAALVILAKANPAVFLLENVVPYASSASASILRNQLKDMGYVTHETILEGQAFNALENRKRWCMVAVTEGIHFDWEMLNMPARQDLRLSDVLDDIPEDHPSWSEMRGLKAKQERDIAEGKNFLMQIFDGSEDHIGTLTKGIAKNRSTDPKIRHPSNPELLRIPTPAEHARVKQFPPELVDGLAATVAHEILGQAIVRGPFEAAAEAIGHALKNFAFERQADSMRDLVEKMVAEISDTASLTVSEIRKPLAGVVYEGPITINDLGATVQDIGNGVGILHKQTALGAVRLGEVLRVQYPKVSSAPNVKHMSRPAPDVSPELAAVMAQTSMFDSPEFHASTPTGTASVRGPRL